MCRNVSVVLQHKEKNDTGQKKVHKVLESWKEQIFSLPLQCYTMFLQTKT